MKIIASPGLSSGEQTALTTALSIHGPSGKAAMKALRAAKKQPSTDLQATPPVGTALVADAAALATKTELKAASSTRWEYHAEHFLGFVRLASIKVIFKSILR